MNNQAKFLSGNLFAHVARMSFAASIGLSAIFIVDLADLYFISLLGHQELAAAIGYAGTIMFFSTSMGIGMSISKSALIAKALGAGQIEEARRLASNTLLLSILISLMFSALIWHYAPELIALLGAVDRTAELAVRFLRIIVPSMPLMMILITCTATLRAYGDGKRSMFSTLSAAVVNGVLDPILIFGLGLGFDGAAYASVVARLVGAVVSMYPLFTRYKAYAPLQLPSFFNDVRPVMAIAIPAILTNLATPIGSSYVTRVISDFGDSAVAGFAVIGRIVPVAFGITFALSGAVGPIIGQNYGAKDYGRVRETYLNGLLFSFIVVMVVSVLMAIYCHEIADIFNAQGEARKLILLFCGPLAPLFYFNALLFVSNAAFNNLGRPFYSTALNWGRQTIGLIPFVIVGSNYYGASGVIIGQYLGGLAFGILAVWFALRLIRMHAEGKIDDLPKKRIKLNWRIPLSSHNPPRGDI